MWSRASAVARWLAPSVVAAAVAAIAMGASEGRGLGRHAFAASIGFAWLAVGPLALAGSIALRAVTTAWRPGEMAARLVDPDGSWPRLAGWVLVVWGAIVGVAWVAFQATWRIASWTAFKPLGAGFLMAAVVVLSVLLAIALAPPVASVLARGLGWCDRRWQRRGHRTLLRPTAIFIGGALIAMVTTYLAWRFFMARRVTHLALGVLDAPAAAVTGLALGHLAWHWLRVGARELVGCVVVATVVAAVLVGLRLVETRPALALAIWGTQPLARSPLERVADLETVRDAIPRATYRPVAVEGAGHRDVMLVTLGGVRADALPPYGGRAAMPGLRELAKRGSVFQWHFASTTAPLQALRTLVIGLDAARVEASDRMDPRYVLLADRLRAGGYETAAFVVGDPAGLARSGLARGLDRMAVEPDGARLAQRAHDWIRARDATAPAMPLFLWVHFELPSFPGPASPPDESPPASGHADADAERRTYEARLATLDADLRTLLLAIADRPPAVAPIVIVAGSRGYSLETRARDGVMVGLDNAQLRVPFLVSGPTLRVMQVGETTSTIDLVPTVLDLAGFVPPADALDGRSLAGIVRGERPPLPVDGLAYARVGSLRAIVKGGWKLVTHGTDRQLYDVRSDPDERTNQAAKRATLTDSLNLLLETRERAMAKPAFSN